MLFNLLNINSVGKLRVTLIKTWKEKKTTKLEKAGIAGIGRLAFFYQSFCPLQSSQNTVMVMLFEAGESGWSNIFSPIIAGSHKKFCSG